MRGLKGRLRAWAKPPRRLTFTRAGKFFMILTLCVGGGALNTGNNLLFLMLGMMISAIVASGIASEAVLRRLEISRRPPQRLHAGSGAFGEFLVTNPKRYASLNVEAIERRAHCTQGPFEQERVGGKDVPWWKFWRVDRFEDAHYLAIARLPELPAGQVTAAWAPYTFPHRGLYHSYGLRLATRFPFGLFHKVSDVEQACDFLVYPARRPAHEWMGQVSARFGDASRHRAGFGEEYFGLRNWRVGEDKRDISWKRSAKRDHFVVREQEEQEKRAIELVVVNRRARGSGVEQMTRQFEWGVSQAGSLIEALEGAGYRIGLRTLDGVIEQGEGAGHLDRMLGHLALVRLHPYGSGQVGLPPGGPEHVGRVGLGFGDALEGAGEEFDLRFEFERLEAEEGA